MTTAWDIEPVETVDITELPAGCNFVVHQSFTLRNGIRL